MSIDLENPRSESNPDWMRSIFQLGELMALTNVDASGNKKKGDALGVNHPFVKGVETGLIRSMESSWISGHDATICETTKLPHDYNYADEGIVKNKADIGYYCIECGKRGSYGKLITV